MINFNKKFEEGTVTCDECGEEETFHAEDFPEFIARIKDVGWNVYKRGSIWEHYCYECRKK